MHECCHYEYLENSTLLWVDGWTLEWVDGWVLTTEELTCTVCMEVFGIRDKDIKSAVKIKDKHITLAGCILAKLMVRIHRLLWQEQ